MTRPALPPLAAHGDTAALVDREAGIVLSWRQLADEVARAASHLATSARPLALLATPDATALVAFWAAFELGRPVLLVHPRWPDSEGRRLTTLAGAAPLPLPAWRERPWRRSSRAPRRAPPYDARAAVFVATSGTSGAAKLVELSRRALAAAAQLSSARLRLRPGARWLLSLPYAHVGGLGILLRARARAGAVICLRGGFDATAVHALIAAERVSHLSLTPTQLARLVAADLAAPPSLEGAVIGGAACPPALAAEARRLGWPLLPSYGMTETAGMIAADAAAPPGASGRALAGVALRIGGDGRLALRSPTRFTRYLGDAPPAPGWWRSANRARLAPDGALFVIGRADDVVSCGGEKVSPSAVEAMLAAHPRVRAACVWAEADARWGHTLSALVEPRADATSLRDELAAWARRHLAPWQRPRRLGLVAALPLTVSGKLDRAACRRL